MKMLLPFILSGGLFFMAGADDSVYMTPVSISLIYKPFEYGDMKFDQAKTQCVFDIERTEWRSVKRRRWSRSSNKQDVDVALLGKDSNVKHMGEWTCGGEKEKTSRLGKLYWQYIVDFPKHPSLGSKWVSITGEIPVELWSGVLNDTTRNIEWEKGKSFTCGEIEITIKEFKEEQEKWVINLENKCFSIKDGITAREVKTFQFLNSNGENLEVEGYGRGRLWSTDFENQDQTYKLKEIPDGINMTYHRMVEKKAVPVDLRFPLHGDSEEQASETNIKKPE